MDLSTDTKHVAKPSPETLLGMKAESSLSSLVGIDVKKRFSQALVGLAEAHPWMHRVHKALLAVLIILTVPLMVMGTGVLIEEMIVDTSVITATLYLIGALATMASGIMLITYCVAGAVDGDGPLKFIPNRKTAKEIRSLASEWKRLKSRLEAYDSAVGAVNADDSPLRVDPEAHATAVDGLRMSYLELKAEKEAFVAKLDARLAPFIGRTRLVEEDRERRKKLQELEYFRNQIMPLISDGSPYEGTKSLGLVIAYDQVKSRYDQPAAAPDLPVDPELEERLERL